MTILLLTFVKMYSDTNLFVSIICGEVKKNFGSRHFNKQRHIFMWLFLFKCITWIGLLVKFLSEFQLRIYAFACCVEVKTVVLIFNYSTETIDSKK